MNDIKILITQKENRKLEFKQQIPAMDKITKTAIAFSNSQGGHLIIGVNDGNDLVGIDESKIVHYEEQVSNSIYDGCYPFILPEIYSVKIQDKFLLVIRFYPSASKPHYIRDKGKLKGTYIRLGSTNKLATLDIIENLELEKRRLTFDSIIHDDIEFKLSEFDGISKHLQQLLGTEPTIVLYEKLKLIVMQREKYCLTNLGVLFSSHKDKLFPYAKIECARFKGVTSKVFIDQASYDGDIIESIELVMGFIQRNIRLGATIGELYRENKWQYPLLAIREVLINAVLHRDYAVAGSDIKLAIYDDMVEITSPGVLNIDKQKLGHGYSELRNPNLGLLFKKLNLIEQWGTGFEKIYQSLKDYPNIQVSIDDDSNYVQIQFAIKQEATQEATQETTQEQIVKLLKLDSHLTRVQLARKLAKSETTIKEHLASLKKKGKITRIGSTKSGHWQVKN